jgi:hypothetical protein
MKNYLKFIFPLFGLSLLSSCEEIANEQKYTINYIFVDITGEEESSNILNDEHIEQLVNSSGWAKGGDVYNGASFRFFTLSNLNMTQSLDLEMKMGETGLSGQPALARQRDVQRFINDKLKPDISAFISKIEKGRDESEVYSNLCKQLSNLSNQPADKKNVVIYSDMLENSNLFSLYGKEVTSKEFENAEKNCQFPDLSDINIYIVPPLNPKNKELVSKSEKAWSNFFASKNAKSFHFDVNLNVE